jgi:DUF1680 family protein
MAGPFVVDTSSSPHAALRPVPLAAVSVEGGLWGARLRTLADVSLRAQHASLEAAGVLDNFRRAASGSGGAFRGLEFADTDLYKWVEAASWTLARGRDRWLEERVEAAVALIAGAQEPDGYLDTFHAGRPSERWSNLRSDHELYCVGHLVLAAVAHRRATGDERLLGVARRAADLVGAVFGPSATGRRPGIDGHPGIEMALVELYRETRAAPYLDQAAYFLEARGHGLVGGGRLGPAYYLDHRPLRQLTQVTGHVVRALYALCGATDLFLETGDRDLLATLDRLWTRMVARQTYVSGGLGARRDTESFGGDLELPNRTACNETCAAVASILWSQRMLAATGEARFADLLEWTLLNALLAGWSLDGESYAYENPLQDEGHRRRQRWYECACCPPNLARLVASLPALLYAVQDDCLVVNQYTGSTARLEVQGRTIAVEQRTRYPWDGEVELRLDGEGEFALRLRIPGWCPGGVVLLVNGAPTATSALPGTHAELRRTWKRGDRVSLRLPMPVRLLRSHPGVLENAGRVALTRGPLLYCLEAADHPGVRLEAVEIDRGGRLEAEWREGQLGGMVVVRGTGVERTPGSAWNGRLYRPHDAVETGPARPVELAAIPYHAWGNRTRGAMQVWVREGAPARPGF